MGASSGELTALEVYLADCAKDGEVFSLSDFAEKGGDTTGDLTVRAKVIENLIRGEPLPGESHRPPLSGFGLRIRNTKKVPVDPAGNRTTRWFRRFFKLKKDRSKRDRPEPVDRLIVDKTLDLSGVTTKLPIELVGCEFKDGLSLDNAEIRSLQLHDSKLKYLHARDLKVHGSLLAQGNFECEEQFVIHNAGVDGDVILAGLPGEDVDKVTSGTTIGSLHAATADIRGTFVFAFCTIRDGMDLTGIEIQGDLHGVGAKLGTEKKRRGLRAHNATIGGRVLLGEDGAANPFTAHGMIDFHGAKIDRAVDLRGATLINEGSVALNLSGARIGSDLQLMSRKGVRTAKESKSRFTRILTSLPIFRLLRPGPGQSPRPEILGEVRLHGAEIGGDLGFFGLTVVVSPEEDAIDATGIIVKGSTYFGGNRQENVRFTGKAVFQNAKIGRNFQIGFEGQEGPYNIFHGELKLSGATIGSNLILDNLVCTHGLDADGVQVTQNIELGSTFRVYGKASFENAKSGENLVLPLTDNHRETRRSTRSLLQGFFWSFRLAPSKVLKGASKKTLRNYNSQREKVAPRRLSINLKGATAKTFKVNTRLGLRSIKLVLDEFQYDSIRFAQRTWLRGVRLPGIIEVPYHYISSTGFIWMIMSIPRIIYRRIARLPKYERLSNALKSLRQMPAKLPLVAWTLKNFKEFFVPGVEYRQAGTADAKALLRRLPRKEAKFSRQTYDHLIGRLKHGGHELTPRTIEWMKQERLRKEIGPRLSTSRLRWPARPMRWLYLTFLKVFAGHGLKISIPALWALTSLAIGWWAFACADKLEIMKSFDSSTMVQIARGTITSDPDPYPEFIPSVYALDVFVPLIDLYQERYWFPQPLSSDEPLRCAQMDQGLADDWVEKCNATLEIWVYSRTVWMLEVTNQATLIPTVKINYLSMVDVVVGRHILLVRYLLPTLGWLLTSIMIAILATRFREVTGLARG